MGIPFWGPHNEDYSILGSILGSSYIGKLPYTARLSTTCTCRALCLRICIWTTSTSAYGTMIFGFTSRLEGLGGFPSKKCEGIVTDSYVICSKVIWPHRVAVPIWLEITQSQQFVRPMIAVRVYSTLEVLKRPRRYSREGRGIVGIPIAS